MAFASCSNCAIHFSADTVGVSRGEIPCAMAAVDDGNVLGDRSVATGRRFNDANRFSAIDERYGSYII